MNAFWLQSWANKYFGRRLRGRTPRRDRTALAVERLDERIVPSGTAPTAPTPLIARVAVNENAVPTAIDLSNLFTDAENDPLTYSVVQTNSNGLLTPTINGSTLTLNYNTNQFGYSYIRVTANDGTSSTTRPFEVIVSPLQGRPESASTTPTTAITIPVFANDPHTSNARQISAGNLQVVQNSTANTAAAVTLTFPESTGDIFANPSGSNRGDFQYRIGTSAADDVAGGLAFNTIRDNTRNNGETSPTGAQVGTVSIDADANGYYAPTESAGSITGKGEYNFNVAVGYFPYASGYLAAWGVNSTGINGGINDRFRSVSPNAGFTANVATVPIGSATFASGTVTIATPVANNFSVGQSVTITGVAPAAYTGTYTITAVGANTFSYALATNPGAITTAGTATITASTTVTNLGGGSTTVRIAGVNSQTDGILLVEHGKNEANFALAMANADGSWTIIVHDNATNDTSYEQDPYAFVYIPKNMPNVVSGRVIGNGTGAPTTQLASGDFTVMRTDTGTYQLTIAGQSPTSGVLLLSAEGGVGNNVDNVVSYQASGNNFIIQSRDLPGSTTVVPGLQDSGTNEPVFSFAFLPFQNDAEFTFNGTQSATSTLGATLTNDLANGTVTYDPTTLPPLTPGMVVVDTFTYTLTNRFGATSTVTTTVNVSIPAPGIVDVANGTLSYTAGFNTANILNVSQTGGIYTISEPNLGITLSQAAIDAGFTYVTLGDNTVITGPSAALSAININTQDQADSVTLTNINLPFTVNGGGNTGDTFTLATTATFTGNGSISGFDTISAASGAKFISATGTLSLAGGTIGTLANPILTQVAVITANASAGSVYLVEDDGATVTATAVGTGTVSISNTTGPLTINAASTTGSGNVTITNSTGLLTLSGAIATLSGNISINNTDAIAIGADVNAGSGSINISGSAINQSASLITTTNAASIVTSGSGDISIDNTSVGGTLTVTSGGGSILFAGLAALTVYQVGTLGDAGNAPSRTIGAKDYTFSAVAGSIGTDARPIQASNFGSDAVNGSNFNLTAGNGGAFFTKWGAIDATLTGASATGSGGIRFVTASASGGNLFVTGNVSAVSGNIYLAADDNITVQGTTVIGGPGFSGTVWIQANRDEGTAGQSLAFANTTSIETTNTTSISTQAPTPTTQSVYIDISGDQGTPSNLTVANIKTGNGGRILLVSNPHGIALEAGRIQQVQNVGNTNRLDAGATGSIVLLAGITATTVADAIGTAALPIRVAGGSVTTVSNFGHVYVTGTSDTTFTGVMSASITGQTAAPTIAYATTGGVLTLGSALSSVNNGAISLSSNGLNGGIVINAPLGNAMTGNVTIDAGINTATLNSTLALASSATVTYVGSTNPFVVAANGLLANTTNNAAVSVASGGTLSPNGSGVSAMALGTLSAASGSTLRFDVNSDTSFDTIDVSGATDITDAIPLIYINGPITAGTTFTIVAKGTPGLVTGQFVGGTSITAANTADFTFTVAYNGVDGNDIVLTAVANTTHHIINVLPTDISYLTVTADNNLTVTQTAGVLAIADSSLPLLLSPSAIVAGWTIDSQNPSLATGPIGTATRLNLFLGAGNDTISSVDAQSLALATTGTGTLTISGLVATSSTNSVTGFTAISASSASSKIVGTTLTLTASAIGSATLSLGTTGTTIVATAGAGGVYLTEDDGASVTVTATGAGNIAIVNNAGLLTFPSATTTGSGTITLRSAGGLMVGANVNAGSGTISIAANTDGSTETDGSQDFSQTAGTISTTNASDTAIAINVNTSSSGTGNAVLDSVTIASGGTLTINSNGGSIVYGGTTALTNKQIGIVGDAGSAPARVLTATNYIFSASGQGSIGSDSRPLQVTNVGADGQSNASNFTLTGGDGGVFVTKWGAIDSTLAGVSVTGLGNIRFVNASAGLNHMYITGNVSAVSGNIFIASDDNLVVTGSTVIGGDSFTGTVWMQANRDLSTTGQSFVFAPSTSIKTSNSTNTTPAIRTPTTQAVYLDIAGDVGNPSFLTVSDITVGNGGRIVLNAIPNSIAAEAGRIQLSTGTNLLTAPNGVVELITGLTANGLSDTIGDSSTPIRVAAGSVVVSNNYGNEYITSLTDTSFANTFTATGTQTSASIISMSSAGSLTLPASLASLQGGSISLSAAGMVTLASGTILGSATTGAINLTGALDGSGDIHLGTGPLTITQSTSSTYSGRISGNQNVTKAGAGILPLMSLQTYTGTTEISGGTLLINGSLAAGGLVSVNANTTVGGTGTINRPVAVTGLLAPGSGLPGNTGALTVGDATTFLVGGKLVVDIRGTTAGLAGTGFDQLITTGALDLANAELEVTLGNYNPALTSYMIIATSGAGSIVNQFANLNEGDTVTASDSNQTFVISYLGGQVTLTAIALAPTTQTLMPGSGAAGSTVMITGTNLTNATVKFNGIAASNVANSDTEIVVTAPVGVNGASTVTVTTPGGTTTAGTFTFTATQPTAPTVTVNGGNGLLDAGQPSGFATFSRVQTIVLTFNTPIESVDPTAFTLNNGTNSITNDGDVVVTGLDTSVLTLTFVGTNATPGVEYLSLADGIWTLTTDLTKVHGSDGVGTGNSVTNNIRRLFGDVNGTGTVDGGDFGLFGSTFGLNDQDPSFNVLFDVNADGSINGGDFGPFGSRFGTGL